MKNKKTILKLYEDYIDEIYSMTSEKLEISNLIIKQENLLERTLSDEQKSIIDKIHILEAKKQDLIDKQVFEFAFSLATNLIIESLNTSNDKTIKCN